MTRAGGLSGALEARVTGRLYRVSLLSVRAVPESPDAVRADGGGAGDQTPKHRDAAERR